MARRPCSLCMSVVLHRRLAQPVESRPIVDHARRGLAPAPRHAAPAAADGSEIPLDVRVQHFFPARTGGLLQATRPHTTPALLLDFQLLRSARAWRAASSGSAVGLGCPAGDRDASPSFASSAAASSTSALLARLRSRGHPPARDRPRSSPMPREPPVNQRRPFPTREQVAHVIDEGRLALFPGKAPRPRAVRV